MGFRLSQFGSRACGLTPTHLCYPWKCVGGATRTPKHEGLHSWLLCPACCLSNENTATSAGPHACQDSRGCAVLFCQCFSNTHVSETSCDIAALVYRQGDRPGSWLLPRCRHCGFGPCVVAVVSHPMAQAGSDIILLPP